MFLNLEECEPSKTAVRDDSGFQATYHDITEMVGAFEKLNLPRCTVFCLCENCTGSLLGYLAFESCGQVPLLLGAGLDKELRENLDGKYRPSLYWAPERMAECLAEELPGKKIFAAYGYVLLDTGRAPYPLHEDLSFLLTTSGSTGSPKLVRHKYGNLEANARNVAKVFSWTKDDVGICDLPMNYTMGLNVINSHLAAGASVLMIKASLVDPGFWTFVRENGGTDFCGVPFSYEILRRIGVDKMDLPKLHTLAEGGGKLTDRMFTWAATWAKESGRRFCATFGTSETSARMAFLDPGMALSKIGSIGKAIPGGELFLLDEVTDEDGNASGELGYRGPNVTMGYAVCLEDLAKGDEFCGEYHTGDIAKRDPDGYYYIVGRKGRFLKLFGLRVSLDEMERILKTQFPGADFVCLGDDRRMTIFCTDRELEAQVVPFAEKKTKLHSSAFRVVILPEIPRNEYGKVLYSALKEKIS